MGLIVPTGPFGNTIVAGRNMLAACSAFRDVVAVASQAEALPFIHFPYANDRLDPFTQLPVAGRPRAIINPPSRQNLGQAGEQLWTNLTNLYLSFEFDPNPLAAGDRGDELIDFTNRVGAIITQLSQLSGQDDPLTSLTYLNLRQINLLNGPAECERQNELDQLFYGATYELVCLGSL